VPRLTLHGIGRTYAEDPPIVALSGVSLTVEQGEFVAIEGPSGSGKSSLLNLIALIDRPSAGVYEIDGAGTATLPESRRAEVRRRGFGFIFQSFHLIPQGSALENVELGLLYHGVARGERRVRALAALERVGLAHRAQQPASKLSGGERQRVAIARAIVGRAPVVVADEPTGNLDSATSRAIVDQLEELHRTGITVVLVTHDPDVAAVAERRIAVRDGQVVGDVRPKRADVMTPATPRADSAPRGHSGNGAPSGVDVGAVHGGDDGRGTRLRAGDLLREALRTLRGRPGRAAALIGAVAVAVALVIVTAGLSQTASSQVSERFDAQRNREVTVAVPFDGANGPRLAAGAEGRVRALAGVESAGLLSAYDTRAVRTPFRDAATDVALVGISPGLLPTADASVGWAPGHVHRLGPRELLIGAVPARQLELAPLAADPAVLVDGVPFAVVGIVQRVRRAPELLGAIVATERDASTFGRPLDVRVLLRTAPGAAPQVARQAPIALDPVAADRFEVDAPADPASLRDEIQSDLATTLVVLTLVAALASMVGVANAMMMNVVERIGEIGLRRAIGARPVHILAQTTTEALLMGLAGGAAGFAAGTFGVLAVTVAKHWQPVLDLRLIPLALAGGAVGGVLGGLAAAVRASRIQPSDALRR
jgi:macrolide transport system ATP-binding/permease protein